MNDLYPHLQNGDGLTNLGFSNRCNAFVWQDDATGETVMANGRSEAREKFNARRMVTAKHATQPRQYIDSARDVTPIKTMADKTVNAYNNWQAFIAKCNDTDSGSQWADRGADHE